ncbi:MAG: hypothetical protein COV63_00535 [Candidatus Nealsonbacteria bacterium CG11_big_fil_rev_8_21_14_0_20_37_68]|nr:MAG: hypothetical protein COV63_00535 [Candidatus Nealsonbacteria bacterium CG11_big_fil_rev_8_21_14_0_20_37_68]
MSAALCAADRPVAPAASRPKKQISGTVKSVFFVASPKGPKVPYPLTDLTGYAIIQMERTKERISSFPDNLPDSEGYYPKGIGLRNS